MWQLHPPSFSSFFSQFESSAVPRPSLKATDEFFAELIKNFPIAVVLFPPTFLFFAIAF